MTRQRTAELVAHYIGKRRLFSAACDTAAQIHDINGQYKAIPFGIPMKASGVVKVRSNNYIVVCFDLAEAGQSLNLPCGKTGNWPGYIYGSLETALAFLDLAFFHNNAAVAWAVPRLHQQQAA